MNLQTVKNVSDCLPLYLPHSLYLKPIAKFNISVSLPPSITGKSISNWDVMEKLRSYIQPDQYSVLKVTKSTLEFIRFEAELDDKTKLKGVLSRLDGRSMKLSAFADVVKIRVCDAKDDFPTRHDWDSFFRDANDMDEMKAGERPDTIHIANLPIRWFCPRHLENEEVVKPSESIFKRIFEKFGDVRAVDIPICDPYRKDMKSHITGMKKFSFDHDLYFEGYVQFSEYIGFVKAMDDFRGMKLVRKEGDKNLAISISVDFDRTKHLSDASMKRRRIIRDRLVQKERAKEEEERKKMQLEEEKKEREKIRQEKLKEDEYNKQRDREDRRKEKHMKKLREKEQDIIDSKIRAEEKKLLIAQRKLESIRVLEALFDRIKLKSNKKTKQIKTEDLRNDSKPDKGSKKFDLRNKLMNRFKTTQENELERQKNRLKKVKSGGILGSALIGSEFKRSPSVNTISSDDSIFDDPASKKAKKKKRDNLSSTSHESGDDEKKVEPINPIIAAPGSFPVYNPETGQFMGMSMGMGMGMYPYAAPPFFPSSTMIRPDFYQNPMPFRGYRGRGRFPRYRGRGPYRGRGGYSHDGDYYKYKSNDYEYDEYDEEHSHRKSKYSRSRSHSRSRRSRSYSRSRSRSRKRSRSHSRKSHSRRRSSRSKSRGRRTKSRSRRRSHSRSRSKPKLVSTRRSRSSGSGWSSRSRSRSRSKRRSWSRTSRSPRKHVIKLQPEKLVLTAKEIQRSVQQKLQERVLEEEKKKSEENYTSDQEVRTEKSPNTPPSIDK